MCAEDAGAKRKYRELKRLPADIRAQVALLKVGGHSYTHQVLPDSQFAHHKNLKW